MLRDDFSIFNYAKQNNMVIVTFDEDFRDLQVVYDYPPKIIWLRMGNTLTLNIMHKLTEKKREILALGDNPDLGVLEIY